MTSKNEGVEEFADKLLKIDRLGAKKIFDRVLEQESSLRLVEKLIVPALEGIGRGWEQGTVALAQVYMSSRLCEELVDQILPRFSQNRISQPRMAIAILNDYHDLGKIIICSALRAGAYELLDYGKVDAQELVRKINDDSIEIILISTLMLRSALEIKEVKRLLLEAGSSTRIIVGGAPFRLDPLLWKEVGADAMGIDVAEAIRAVSLCMEVEEGI